MTTAVAQSPVFIGFFTFFRFAPLPLPLSAFNLSFSTTLLPMTYSIIIPVYNRPDEVDELLASLVRQSVRDFEVIVVEDGSQITCSDVCGKYSGQLDLHYYAKPNSGPGQSRNYGVERAQGEYVIILDSDVVLPDGYLAAVSRELERKPADAFGGPDSAHDSFTPTQKAISYSMTSFFTTGGIRGGKKKLDKFYPRSFNMGVRRDVYNRLGGFSKMRFGEDIDFSIRIFKAGCSCRLLPEAWVWHKRRTDFRKFYRQVYNSGVARINLYKKYPESLKLVHLLPMVFTVGMVLLAIALVTGIVLAVAATGQCARATGIALCGVAVLLPALYSAIILVHSACLNRSLLIGLLSVRAAFTQLMGYGFGFIDAWWRRGVRGKDEFSAFENTFYK